MIALDALSAYWIASHTSEDGGLNVTLSSLSRNGFKTHVLHLSNHQAQGLEEELQVNRPHLGLVCEAGLPGPAHPSLPWCRVAGEPPDLSRRFLPAVMCGASRC